MLNSTYQESVDYLIMFTSLTTFKGIFSVIHRQKLLQIPIARYETESTLGTVMKIQMQFNFLFLHLAFLFTTISDATSQQQQLILIGITVSSLLYASVLVLTDYRWLLKIYRYENHLLREDYPVIEFLAIQGSLFIFTLLVFMMFGVAILIAIQWFVIPLISDLMYLILCIYKLPSIIKCHESNQKPNLTYFGFLEDYCILLFYAYYRGCPHNFQKLETDIGMCISLTIFILIQQGIVAYQYYVQPQLYKVKDQVFSIEDFRSSGMYSIADLNSQIECSICLQGVDAINPLQLQLDAKDQLVQTKCSHYFHENCLIAWLKVKKLCPICRHELEQQQ